MGIYDVHQVKLSVDFFDVLLRRITQTKFTSFYNIIINKYQRYEPTLLRTTVFIMF